MLVNRSIVSSARGPPSCVLRFWGCPESGAHLHTLMTSYGVGGSFLDWVLEGNLAGFLGCVFEVRPAPGARKGFQKCGGFAPRGLIQHFMGCCPLPQNWGAASARSPLPQSHS